MTMDFEDASNEDFEDYEMAEDNKVKNRYSLEVRRAIEDHLEETRLRKEFDYMFDDDFGEEE